MSTACSSTSASTRSSPAVRRALGRAERGRQRVRDDVAVELLHDVEGHAEDARRPRRRRARAARARAPRSALQHARLAQHVVRRGRQRRRRRAGAAPSARRRARAGTSRSSGPSPMRVAIERPGAQPVLVEPRLERAPHDERRQRQGGRLRRRVDDVDRAAHCSRWRRRAARRAIDQRCVSVGPS